MRLMFDGFLAKKDAGKRYPFLRLDDLPYSREQHSVNECSKSIASLIFLRSRNVLVSPYKYGAKAGSFSPFCLQISSNIPLS